MIGQSLRIEPRPKINRSLNIFLPVFAIFFALLLGALILTLSGRNAYEGYVSIFSEAFLRPGALTATILTATPLIFTGLTAALAFRARVWNIGADGQLMIGAISASGIAIFLQGANGWITIPAMIFSGALGGIIWAWVPAYLRAKFSTNEVLTTLMFNYLAPLLLGYLIFSSQSYWRDLEGPTAKIFPQGKEIPWESFWPSLGQDTVVPLGFIVALLLDCFMHLVLNYTKYGFELLVATDSPRASDYTGIKTKQLLFTVFLLSAALAGIAGASQVGDFSHRIEPRTLQFAAYGYMGIAVAAVARYQPIAVVIAAFFLGGLVNANLSLQGPELPLGLLGVIQGLILLFVASFEILSTHRIVRRRSSAH